MPEPDLTDLKISEITAGPGYLLIGGKAVSHTQGGITVTITPGTRNRTVDFYGETPVQVIHIGDDCRITAPLAQWSAGVLALAYDPGKNEEGAYGIGRSAGYVYGTEELEVIPVGASVQDKKVKFWKSCPVGQIELAHNYDADRVFNVEFVALIDQTKDDGELLGAIYLGATEPEGSGS